MLGRIESTRTNAKKLKEAKMTRGKVTSQDDKWETDHLLMFGDAGEDWPLELDKYHPDFPEWVEYLPRRFQECAFFAAFVWPSRNSPLESCHDLNVTIEWDACGLGVVPCIVCSGCLWLRLKHRQIHGVEALRMQGFPIHKIPAHLHAYVSHKKFMELAGNSFSGFVVTPALTSVFKDAPWDLVALATASRKREVPEEVPVEVLVEVPVEVHSDSVELDTIFNEVMQAVQVPVDLSCSDDGISSTESSGEDSD